MNNSPYTIYKLNNKLFQKTEGLKLNDIYVEDWSESVDIAYMFFDDRSFHHQLSNILRRHKHFNVNQFHKLTITNSCVLEYLKRNSKRSDENFVKDLFSEPYLLHAIAFLKLMDIDEIEKEYGNASNDNDPACAALVAYRGGIEKKFVVIEKFFKLFKYGFIADGRGELADFIEII